MLTPGTRAGAGRARRGPASARLRSRSSSARERTAFAGPLDLDQSAAAQPDDVDVDLGRRVFASNRGRGPARRRRSRRSRPRCCRGATVPATSLAQAIASASATATNAAVIAAVRVPPSALSTSASTWIVHGPERLAVDRLRGGCGRSAAGSRWPGRRAPRASPRRRAARQHRVFGRQPADRPCPPGTAGPYSEICAVTSTSRRARTGRARCRGCCGRNPRSMVTGRS